MSEWPGIDIEVSGLAVLGFTDLGARGFRC